MMLSAHIFMFIGLIAFSLSMKRHFKQCYPQRKIPSLKVLSLFRMSGYLSLFVSIYLCVIAQGVGLGLVVWFGAITIAGLLQVMLLAYKPQWMIPTEVVALLCISSYIGTNI